MSLRGITSAAGALIMVAVLAVPATAATGPSVKDAKRLAALLRSKSIGCNKLMDVSSSPAPIHHMAARVVRNGYAVCGLSGAQTGAADLYVFSGTKQLDKQLVTIKKVACAITTDLGGSGLGQVNFFLVTGPNWAIAFQGSAADGTAIATTVGQSGAPLDCSGGG